jgi:hypothetical protein
MSMILLIVLLLLLFGAIPWSGWHSYGWGPSGGIGLLLVILVILILLGRI